MRKKCQKIMFLPRYAIIRGRFEKMVIIFDFSGPELPKTACFPLSKLFVFGLYLSKSSKKAHFSSFFHHFSTRTFLDDLGICSNSIGKLSFRPSTSPRRDIRKIRNYARAIVLTYYQRQRRQRQRRHTNTNIPQKHVFCTNYIP